MATKLKVTAGQQRVFDRFVEAQGDKPFRRQDLADALYEQMRPRLMGNARQLADHFMQQLHKEHKLVKAGHVHWRLVVPAARTLKGGRAVPVLGGTTDLKLTTHCPEKWVSIDLETGDIWAGSADGWKRASGDVAGEVSAILTEKLKQAAA